MAFAAMVVIYGIAYFQRTGIPGTIFDELQHDFSLSASAVTALGALFSLRLRRHAARSGRCGGPLWRTATFAVWQHNHVRRSPCCFPVRIPQVMLFTSRGIIRFGSSFVYLSIVKEVDTLFARAPLRRAVGTGDVGELSGNVVATLPFERAVHGFGWRDTLMAVAGISLVAIVVARVVLRRLNHVPIVARAYL